MVVGSTTFVGQEVRGSRAVVDGTSYKLHRLIFQWHNGLCPYELDHEDRDPGNNRIGNLRPSTHSENVLNADLRSDNTTGVRGVAPYRNKYQVHQTRNGIRCFLGYFDTVKEATAAVEKFERGPAGERLRT